MGVMALSSFLCSFLVFLYLAQRHMEIVSKMEGLETDVVEQQTIGKQYECDSVVRCMQCLCSLAE
jgi:hypothetical protein